MPEPPSNDAAGSVSARDEPRDGLPLPALAAFVELDARVLLGREGQPPRRGHEDAPRGDGERAAVQPDRPAEVAAGIRARRMRDRLHEVPRALRVASVRVRGAWGVAVGRRHRAGRADHEFVASRRDAHAEGGDDIEAELFLMLQHDDRGVIERFRLMFFRHNEFGAGDMGPGEPARTRKAADAGRRQRGDRKSTRLNSSHIPLSRMPSSA